MNRFFCKKRNGILYSITLTVLILIIGHANANEIKVLGIVMVENSNQERPLTVFIDAASGKAFMDPSSDKEETFLFDLAKSKVYSVDHQKEMVIDIDMLPKYVPDERLKPLSLASGANSFSVNNFNGSQQDVKADTATCLSIYTSPELAKLPGVSEFFNLYGRVIKLGNVGNVFKSLNDKSASRYCVYAKEYIYKNVHSNGVPLKLEKQNNSLLEIVSVTNNMIADKRMFLLPQGYTKTSMREQIIQAVSKEQQSKK